MRSAHFLTLPSLIVATLAACSGAADINLSGAAGDDGGGVIGVDATVEAAQGTDGTVGGNRDVAVTLDSPNPPGDATGHDTGLPPPTFRCGDADAGAGRLCSQPVPTCCADQTLGVATYTCVASPSACAGTSQAPITCHDGADCAGHLCCGAFDGFQYISVQCKSTCPTTQDGGALQYLRFCNPNDVNACSDLGLQCGESGVLTGFYRCN